MDRWSAWRTLRPQELRQRNGREQGQSIRKQLAPSRPNADSNGVRILRSHRPRAAGTRPRQTLPIICTVVTTHCSASASGGQSAAIGRANCGAPTRRAAPVPSPQTSKCQHWGLCYAAPTDSKSPTELRARQHPRPRRPWRAGGVVRSVTLGVRRPTRPPAPGTCTRRVHGLRFVCVNRGPEHQLDNMLATPQLLFLHEHLFHEVRRSGSPRGRSAAAARPPHAWLLNTGPTFPWRDCDRELHIALSVTCSTGPKTATTVPSTSRSGACGDN